jgi:hypothetical protein
MDPNEERNDDVTVSPGMSDGSGVDETDEANESGVLPDPEDDQEDDAIDDEDAGQASTPVPPAV